MLLEPEDSADCVHLRATYIWGAISGALSYRLQIAKDPGFSTIVRNIDKIGSNFVNVVLDSPLTTYYWHVRAEDSTNIGLWSVTQLFSTTIKEPALLVPANLSTGQPLNMNFNWTEGNSQELHSIQISKQANFIETVVDSSDLVNPNFSVTLPDYNTEYYWRVKSQYLNCSSTWSELRKFKTKISPPKLVNPDSGAIKQPLNIVFQWEPVTDADYYEINVSLNPSFTEIFQGTKGIQSNQILLKNFAPSTVYYWRVQAANEEGKSDWSTTFKFTTGKRGAEIPRLISPKSGSTLVPIDAKLVWFKSNDADRYIVQVSEDEYFSGFEFNRDDITDTSVTISGLEYYKRYFWRVAAINDSGQTRWSEEWNFRTTAQAPTDEPILIAPPDKLENTEIHLKFIWNAVPRADGYHLQISEDENFTENALFFNSDKVWATEANIYDMSYGTRYYWRVAGFNEAGKTDWSEVWSFTTKTSSGFKDEQMGNLVIRIIPNPVGEYATIELKAEEVYKINISIINIIGSASMNFGEFNLQSGQMTVPFNTKSLPDGFYYILITTQSQKFVLPFIVRK
jgi:hypothetical protein